MRANLQVRAVTVCRLVSIAVIFLLVSTGCSDDSTDGGSDDTGNPPTDSGDTMTDTSAEDSGEQDTASDTDEFDDGGPDDTTNDDAEDVTDDDPLACPALADSGGSEVRVAPSEADDLPQIVREADPGTTILLEDGVYELTSGQALQFRADGVTLRSASDDARSVVIDGQYELDEIAYVVASDVTLAHVTLQHAVNHPVHVTPTGDATENVTGTLLYGLRLIDNGEQFVKVNSNAGRTAWVDDGRIECSYFQMTDDGRPHVERNPGGCYTGGIDVHSARGWVVRNNEFRGIYCAGEGLAEHAIHFWKSARDTLVENNLIVNCARGIGFGLIEDGEGREYDDDPYPDVTGHIGHYNGVIRNNVIVADIDYYDTGIELAQARGARVLHNTIYTPDASNAYSSIDYRFANTNVEIVNNLVERITARNDASGHAEPNLEQIDASLFVDPASEDFHLVEGATDAIDQGADVFGTGVDIDGEPHTAGSAPDLGADEY